MPVVLRIYKGEQLLGVKQFVDGQIVFGQPGEVQVALEGEKVSVIHAAIEERDAGWYVCDLGSENGTLKNGEPVLDAPIASGDVVQIADFRIEFYLGVPKPKAPPTGAPEATAAAAATAPAAPAVPQAPPQPVATKPAAPFDPVPAPKNSPAETNLAKAAQTEKPKAASTQTSAQPAQQASAQPTPAPAAKSASSPAANPAARAASPSASPSASKQASTPTPSVPDSAPASASAVAPATASPAKPAAANGPAPQVPVSAPAAGAAAAAGFSLSTPKAKAAKPANRGAHEKKKRKGKTFAPPSKFSNVREFVKPSKGTVVEVLVAWRERVIASYHFAGKRTVMMGSQPDCDVVLPLFSSRVRKMPILKIDSQAVVLVTPEITGELIRDQVSASFVELLRQNRMQKDGAAYAVVLNQGELIRLELSDQISVIIRYVSDSPKPLVAPMLDLTTSEAVGVILSFLLVSLLGLYMFIHKPAEGLLDEENTEPARVALVLTPPTPPPNLPVPPPPKAPEPPKEVDPPPPPPPKVVKATPAPQKTEVKPVSMPKAATNLTNKHDPGMSANAAPNKNKTGPRALTSPKSGGSIKTADKDGSQMKSPQRDVTKSGMFSVFGNGGANDQLSQNTSGSGELAGLADAATGKSGYGENRPGQGLGSAVKDTGQGGSGNALTGIAGGIGTQGRGSGNSGYGTGGLGNRASTKIVTGGTEESYSATIDREAIRRVVKANERVIRTCYERQLNRNPDLFGKLVLSWEIGEQGRVVSVGVKSNELGNKAVADCILDRLRTWKFPEPPTSQVVEVAYPFFFSN